LTDIELIKRQKQLSVQEEESHKTKD